MKKLLSSLLAGSLFTTTTINVVACGPSVKENGLKDLPSVYSIEANDTKKIIESKVLEEFENNEINFDGTEFDILLETETGRQEITNEYVAQNKDVLWIKIKDQVANPYNDQRIYVYDIRTNLSDYSFELHQKITIKTFATTVFDFIFRQVNVLASQDDYQLFVNGIDETQSTKEDLISVTDEIKIQAKTSSRVLYGEMTPKVNFQLVGLDTMMNSVLSTLTQHTSSKTIKETLDKTVPFWESNVNVIIDRQGSNVDFDENYITYPDDNIVFESKTESELYSGSVSKTIAKEYYDDVFKGEVTVGAGITKTNLASKISEAINTKLSLRDKEYKLDPSKIKLGSDIPETGRLTKNMTGTFSIEDGFFKNSLKLNLVGANITSLAWKTTPWKNYEALVEFLNETIANDSELNYLSLEKDLTIEDSDETIVDENWAPINPGKFSLLFLRGKESSLYLDPTNSYVGFYLQHS